MHSSIIYSWNPLPNACARTFSVLRIYTCVPPLSYSSIFLVSKNNIMLNIVSGYFLKNCVPKINLHWVFFCSTCLFLWLCNI